MGLGIAIAPPGEDSDDELASASSVEVHERLGEPATFRLRYPMDVADDDFPLVTDARLAAGSDICIVVPLADSSECLIRGVVHAHQLHFEHGIAGSWLEVQGSDRLVTMDRESRSAIWQGTASSAVTTILGGYGFTPDVENTSASYTELKHVLVQRDSDLRFVRRLARRNGFYLWLTSDDKGVQTAHFKPLSLDDTPETELAINVSPPNLGAFDISWDVERLTSVVGLQLDLSDLSDLDGGAESPLNVMSDEGLANITGDTRSVFLAAPADDGGDLAKRGAGALVDADLFVKATCRTSLAQRGCGARANTLVTVNGLGRRHSGTYLVSSVKHTIDAAAHTMEIELLRNAWGT